MNKRAPILILFAVALVCVVAVMSTRRNSSRVAGPSEKPSTEAHAPSAPVDTNMVDSAAKPLEQSSAPTESSGRAAPVAAPVEAANAPPPAPDSASAPSGATPAPSGAEELDLNLDTADLLNPLVMKRLLEKYKSASELYKQMPDSRREELITALWADQKLDDAAAELLPLAETSARRASILSQIHPRTPDLETDSQDVNPAAPDQRLVDLLNAPTSSAIEPDEMVARMNLAFEVNPATGLDWARKAQKELPGDYRVSLRADSQVLRAAGSGVEVTPEERQAAEADILQAAQQEQWNDATPWDRIDAYYAMMNSSDPERARSFFRQQLAKEQNPEARGVLVSLLAALDNPPQQP